MKQLTPEVTRLVVAARVVAFGDQRAEAIRELDEASEAFADDVAGDDNDLSILGKDAG